MPTDTLKQLGRVVSYWPMQKIKCQICHFSEGSQLRYIIVTLIFATFFLRDFCGYLNFGSVNIMGPGPLIKIYGRGFHECLIRIYFMFFYVIIVFLGPKIPIGSVLAKEKEINKRV